MAAGMLYRVSPSRPSRRERWLAELTDALEQAHLLALQVGGYADIAGLSESIEAVQRQISELRTGVSDAICSDDPIWTLLPHWRGNREA